MTNKEEKSWIVKDVSGKIFGPLSTSHVLSEIDKGYFIGEEMIALYPGGNWTPISRAAQFSDRLLDVLALESKPPSRDVTQPSQKPKRGSLSGTAVKNTDDEDTVIRTQNSSSGKSSTNATRTVPDAKENSTHSQVDSGTATNQSSGSRTGFNSDGVVIELTDLKTLEDKENRSKLGVPAILICTGVCLLVVAFLFSGGKRGDENRIHLLAPRLNQPGIADAKVREKFKRGLAAFQTDTFTGYEKAENDLVEAFQGASQDPEAQKKKAELASTLCLIYRELWPFSYQDSRDSKTISIVMQEAKRIDPGGLNGALCEIVQLMTSGRTSDAQGLTDSMLVEESQAPVLFEIRSDLYSSGHDYGNAAAYANQARTLWPAWQKTSIDEAKARVASQQFPQAMQLFQNVLAIVPNHPVAKIELGLVEFTEFDHLDKAIGLLKSALDSGERVTRETASRGNYGLAAIYVKQNHIKKAVDFARRAYALNSGNVAAKELLVKLAGAGELKKSKPDEGELFFLGEQHLRAGDCFSAQAEFKAAFEADPKNATAALKAGKCLWQLNQTDEAIEWLKKAISADRNLIAAYAELADDYAKRFDYFSAMRVLQQVQRIAPQSYEVYRGFATVELRRNNFQAAATFAQRALKLYETDVETLIIMGKAQVGLQNYQDAKRYIGKAIELDYNNTAAQSLAGKIEAGLHGVDSGAAYIREMINHYVITKGQQVPQAAIDYRVTLGEIYMQDERYSQAEEMYRQALSIDPNNKQALIDLGKVMQAQNRSPDALEMYLKAAVLDPSDADPIFQSAQVYGDVGKLNDSVTQYQRVLRINSRYPRAHLNLGRAYLRLGDARHALDESVEERRINPDLAEAYVLAGECYFSLGQYSNCASEYQKAVSKKSQNSETLIKMARCYRLTGALDSAQSLLRQAQSHESGNPDIYKEQGAIYQMKNMADDAIVAYDKYLMLVPNATDRTEIENAIKKIQSGDNGANP